jgi:hypothetical protein
MNSIIVAIDSPTHYLPHLLFARVKDAHVAFEVLTAVVMKIYIPEDTTLQWMPMSPKSYLTFSFYSYYIFYVFLIAHMRAKCPAYLILIL